MDSNKEVTPSTSKFALKQNKNPQERATSSEKSISSKSESKSKVRKIDKKLDSKKTLHTSLKQSSSFQELHKNVTRLHDRTKLVRGKLKSIKFPPEVTSLPNSSLSTEEDVLREIHRLQLLLKKMQLENSATSVPEPHTEKETKNISKLNESEDVKSTQNPNPTEDKPKQRKDRSKKKEKITDENSATYVPESHTETKTKKISKLNESEDVKSTQNPNLTEDKPKQRKDRSKKKKKITHENELQKLYVSHINEIVNNSNDNNDNKTHNSKNDPKVPVFKNGDDLEEFAVQCVEAGLGQIVDAELRVNAKNNHQSFISLAGGSDAMIKSMTGRKYALDGDVVRAFVRNKSEENRDSVCELDDSIPVVDDSNENIDNPDEVLVEILKKSEESATSIRERAFVIRIVKEAGNRRFVGSIAFKNPIKHDDGEYYKFKPRDTKAPIMCIPVEPCEYLLKQYQDDDILGYLFVAEVVAIEENGRCLGKLIAPVGKVGDLAAEIKAILMHNKLDDVQKFEQRFEDMWNDPIKIEKSDLETREDLRGECIFTIDPLTARDLDDAVSCKKLDDEKYEIGVHISDVAHFLEESSELDELVKMRATSIYLVNEVIHMLPKTLCMKCSLLPNEDKYTFSVFWVMDKEANVLSTRFTRSIIRSCTQLAYEDAQKIIDNPNEIFNDNDFPNISNDFKVNDIVERVKILNSLAETMRNKRFSNGSLSIDKPQFYFNFDAETGEPISYEIANRLTANFLIEEFMLLANQSVAQFIYKQFPDIAFLRSHQPPKPSALKSLKVKLNAMGIELDMSSSKTLYDGLKKVCASSSSPEIVSVAMNYLLTKPMMRAKYFCSENVDTDTGLRHYALAIPIYTHFTSPIRRYPDILVHRLLSAALKYTSPPKRTPLELHELARICNEQKFNAKNAGQESSNLYFKRYINEKKKIDVRAVVVDIYKHSVEVITLDTGLLIIIPYKLQKVVVDSSKAPNILYISEPNSTKPRLELKMFSPVDVRLTIWDGMLTGFFVSPDLKQRETNEIAASKAKAKSAKRVSPTPTEPVDKPKRNRTRKKASLRKTQEKVDSEGAETKGSR